MKKEYEEYLNRLGIPTNDAKSNGGRIPDYCHYGSWLRKNDPVAFEVGFYEYKSERCARARAEYRSRSY